MATERARIQTIVDTKANWQQINPILLKGEIGLEVNTSGGSNYNMKIGDGMTAWNLLPYIAFSASAQTVATISLSKDEYDAMESHDAYTAYYVTDENGNVKQYLGDIELSSGSGAPAVTATALFTIAARGMVSTVTETPPTVHITCDTGYYFDTPVTCTLGGNQRQKSNSTPAIGVIANFFGYCDPIFISPLPDGVLCTVGNDTVPADRTLVYGGIAWYWSTVNNGVGGSYDDSEGNMLTYPGSIGSDGYSASGGISPTYIKQILEYVHASAWEEY